MWTSYMEPLPPFPSIVELGVQWHFTEITVGLDEAGGDFMTEEEQTTQANPSKPPRMQRAILWILASSINDDFRGGPSDQ